MLSDDIMSIDSISALNGETSMKLIVLSVSKTYFMLSVFVILSRVSDKYNTENNHGFCQTVSDYKILNLVLC